jgi:hypothetical protein
MFFARQLTLQFHDSVKRVPDLRTIFSVDPFLTSFVKTIEVNVRCANLGNVLDVVGFGLDVVDGCGGLTVLLAFDFSSYVRTRRLRGGIFEAWY